MKVYKQSMPKHLREFDISYFKTFKVLLITLWYIQFEIRFNKKHYNKAMN